jgi:uncharacterized phiE125 gp8 family phage protein
MATENLTLAQFFGTQRNPFNYVKIEQINRDIQTAWLTLDEISQQLNLVDDQSQDAYLESLELATRMAIEDYLGMTIFSTQWRVYYGNVGNFGTAVYLDLPEVSTGYKGAVANTINSVAYYNDANALTVLASSYYVYDNTGNRIIITSIPDTLSQIVANPIVVTYTTSADFAAQYPVIKQAGLLMLTHLYNNRSNTTEGRMAELPWGVERLLRPYKPLVM